MRLRGYPTNGSPAVSYVGSPVGSIIGNAALPVGKLIQVPGLPGPPGGGGSGDMTAEVYDPNGVEDDAFDQDNMVDGTTNKNYTAVEKAKLAGVASGATSNSTDAQLRDRSTHTGSQASSTISDFTEAVQDTVAALLAQGTNVTLTYDDTANTLTVASSGGAGGGGGLDAEAVRDAIGVALIGTGLISVSVNDAADTITISTTATANDTDANLKARANHTGTQSADTLTDGTTNKAFLATERTKLSGIATGATANSSDATLLARANHTGTQTASTISDFNTAADARVSAAVGSTVQGYDADLNTIAGLTATTDNFLVAVSNAWASRTPAQVRTTLNVADGATANSSNATLLARANHTGTQSADTITDGTTNKAYTAAEKTKLAAISGTNTGDQTSIAGISGTKAQFNTAVSDGDIVYTDNAALTDTRTPTDGSVTTAKFAAATLVTASETIGSNNNDTTVPTSAAVKAYADSVGGGGATVSPAQLHKFPDMRVEDLATLVAAPGGTLTTTNVAGGTTTTIASGVARAALSNPGGLAASNLGALTLIGTTASELVAISGSYMAANWKVASTGTSGVVTFPTAPWGVEFYVSNSRYVEFQIAVASGGTTPYRIWIDDRPMTYLPVVPVWTAGAGATLKIDLGTGVGTDRSTHKIRFMSHMLAIANIWTEPAGVIHPTGKTDQDDWPRVMVLGDSLTEGFTYNTGLSMGTWLPRWANLCGIKDFWNAAIAGTSFNLANGSYTNYKARATSDVLPFNPDIVIAGTWYNDKATGRTAAQIAADVGTTIDNLNAGSNDPDLIIVLGAPDSAGVNGSDFTAIDSAVKTTAASKGAALILPTTGEVVGPTGTSLMTAGPWFTTTNKTNFIGADNLHPTDAGHNYMAYRMREAFEAILRAL